MKANQDRPSLQESPSIGLSQLLCFWIGLRPEQGLQPADPFLLESHSVRGVDLATPRAVANAFTVATGRLVHLSQAAGVVCDFGLLLSEARTVFILRGGPVRAWFRIYNL